MLTLYLIINNIIVVGRLKWQDAICKARDGCSWSA